MEINIEKINTNPITAERILGMYKIDRQDHVSYEHYLKSKKLFESKINNSEIETKNENLLLETKNKILKQPENKIATYIVKALEDDNIEIQRIGASLVENAPKDQREDLYILVHKKVIDGLNNKDVHIQRIAMNMIQFVPENMQEQLKEITLEKIIEVFNSHNVDEWRVMAKKINLVPHREQDNLRDIVYEKIVDALNKNDLRIQRLAAVMVRYAPTSKQTELEHIVREKFELAKRNGMFKEIVRSSLYLKSERKSDSTFSREVFAKTGSDTTLLLGKQFKDNLILRHIEEPCFSAWRKAYESHNNWSMADFNYVPIEPMYSFRYDHKNKLVNVASGVLDINLEEWHAFSGNTFRDDLDKQKSKILAVLKDLNIDHGHPNDSNFCLRFHRDKDGSVDISKVPRIYLIDFDKAVKL